MVKYLRYSVCFLIDGNTDVKERSKSVLRCRNLLEKDKEQFIKARDDKLGPEEKSSDEMTTLPKDAFSMRTLVDNHVKFEDGIQAAEKTTIKDLTKHWYTNYIIIF